MTMGPGARIGPYEIVSALGAGGMGEVYRARDTRLQRDVAIKILPDSVSHDEDRIARFSREAQLLASLNHPHIAQIYGVEEDVDGHRAIAMEFVDGESLALRLGRASLPLDESIQMARQIAEALEAAHERGIVHRDLKPANIMITRDGDVKVLDFGLAREEVLAPSAPGISKSPTITSPAALTAAGVILGTAAYMSPEQAKGRPTDKRSDIWSFGCVLFEILTGRQAFAADTISETLAAILRGSPDLASLPAATPTPIRSLLARCLEKDVKLRLRDIGEARIQLGRLEDPAESARADRGRFSAWPWLITTTAIVAALTVVGWPARRSAPLSGKFAIDAPDGATFFSNGPMLAVSPDSASIAYVATDAEAQTSIWLRNLGDIEARPLKGTEDAFAPFWSPDSKWLGFFGENQLKVAEVATGRVQTLLPMRGGNGGAWRSDGVILAAGDPGAGYGIYRLTLENTTVTPVIDQTRVPSQRNWAWPTFLPTGKLIYVARETGDAWHAFLSDIDEPTHPRLLFETQSKIEYAEPGWVFFVAADRLLAQRIDAATGALHGDARGLAGDLLGASANARKAFSVSSNIVAFRERAGVAQILLYDRAGRTLRVLGKPNDTYPVGFSPDNTRVLLRRGEGDVWTVAVDGTGETRVTFDVADDRTPVWSPDGTRIAVVRNGSVVQAAADGRGQEEVLGPVNRGSLIQWIPGRLVFENAGGAAILQLAKALQPVDFAALPASARELQFSPDGKLIAYSLRQRGNSQVYVQSVAEGARWQVSRTGGRQPRWRGDGRELFFLSANGNLSSVEASATGGFERSIERPLFSVGGTTGLPGNVGFFYDVSRDGQRFVYSTMITKDTKAPIQTIVNWQALLGQ